MASRVPAAARPSASVPVSAPPRAGLFAFVPSRACVAYVGSEVLLRATAGPGANWTMDAYRVHTRLRETGEATFFGAFPCMHYERCFIPTCH